MDDKSENDYIIKLVKENINDIVKNGLDAALIDIIKKFDNKIFLSEKNIENQVYKLKDSISNIEFKIVDILGQFTNVNYQIDLK